MSIIQSRFFICAQICYILITWCALQILPGAETYSTMLALIGTWVLTSIIYRNYRNRNTAGWWTLLISTTILSIGIIANVHYFTTISGGTTAIPVLNNPDAHRYYCDALAHSNLPGGIPAPPSQRGYGFMISYIWKITGITIVAPLILNMLLTLLCIIISGIISERIISYHKKHSSQWISTCAMIMTASICYYITSGTVLLKEATICFGFALCTLALSSLLKKDFSTISKRDLSCFFIGIIILAVIRYSFIFFVIITIILTFNKNSIRKTIATQLIMLSICICVLVCTSLYLSSLEHNSIDNTAEIIGGNDNASFFFSSKYHYIYDQIFGDYFSYPVWKRILCLPISAITQFLIPFPWNYGRDTIYGYTLDYAHIAYPWYFIGGLIVYFIFAAWRKSPVALNHITIIGIILWLIPAYLFAGTVSRYALPFIPLLIPAAVYTWDQYIHRKSLRVWACIYCVLLGATLIICHNLQQSAIQ